MADQGKWFKLWLSARRDPVIGNLSLENFSRWCLFGCYLKEHGNSGMICLMAPAIPLQKALEVSTYTDALSVLKLLPNCVVEEKQNPTVSSETILTVTWKNWMKYQGDLSSERVRKYRLRETAKKRGEEKRREENKKSVFVPPTLSEIQSFSLSENLSLDFQKFFNHYESKGWMVGRNKMKNWKAAARLAAKDWANASGQPGQGIPTWMRTNKQN